jgi:hypothetical protein
MADELARTKTLQLNNLDKPYFVEFTSGDADEAQISASLGGILSSARIRARSPRLQVRVGDYKFDNTNSVYSGFPHMGSLPLDDDYDVLRSNFWMISDGLYKAAAEQITRKRNALREIAEPDQTPDFAPAKPVQIIEAPEKLDFSQKQWEQILREASGRFVAHPNIMGSLLRLRAIESTYRLINSEGTVIRVPQELCDIAVKAEAEAPDGSRVWNYQSVTVLKPADFPNQDQLDKMIDTLASETESMAKAPIADDYDGPVLFEGQAAAQMVASVMTDALRLQRKPIAPPGANGGQILEGVWTSRLNSKVLPEWLSLVDDPLQKDFEGKPLAGFFEVDDEGVPAQRVQLVTNGTLKGFLLSREPVRDFNASNGHGRLPGAYGAEAAVIGNLFVEAGKTVKEAELKAQFLQKVKDAGLKYGLLIRRLDFPSTADMEEVQSLARQVQKGGYARTLNAPLLAYRVYPDGHEELVRGLRFKDFSAKDLRDLAAASDERVVYNYVNNGSSFNYADAGNDATTSSIICPSLLFDNLELARAENEPGKKPTVAPPALIAQQ